MTIIYTTFIVLFTLLYFLLLASMYKWSRWLYGWRVHYLFKTPAEAAAAFNEATGQLQRERYRFSLALERLTILAVHPNRRYYELRLSVPVASLTTEAGDAVAIAEIASEVARKLVERHRRVK